MMKSNRLEEGDSGYQYVPFVVEKTAYGERSVRYLLAVA